MSSPVKSRYPAGIAHIISNEAAERFSYYGMRCILVIYMTEFLVDSAGLPDTLSDEAASAWFHTFVTANYLFPFFGALLSDIFWGKYLTIFRLSLVYCLGHTVLALTTGQMGLAAGLLLIAIGSGGIKPCVSAHLGDQFDVSRSNLVESAFGVFYFAINLGAFISTLLTPYLLEVAGPHVAFGLPGVFMFFATWVFWLGRRKFIAIPPTGWKQYRQVLLEKESLQATKGLCILYLFIAAFWSLFDQMGSSWVLQANRMDRQVDLSFGLSSANWLQFEILPSQLQALNPVLILLFIPLFMKWVYPAIGKIFELTPLKKMVLGMLLASMSFMVLGVAEMQLELSRASILWQVAAYALLTAGEVMVSITSLEFSYTQAPNAMKSLVMGLYFLSVALGNAITAAVNYLIVETGLKSSLAGPNYFFFFAGYMLLTALLFLFFIRSYRPRYHLQSIDQTSLPKPPPGVAPPGG